MTTVNLLLLPGDGIGQEITAEVEKLMAWLSANTSYSFNCTKALIGGAAIDASGTPYPDETRDAVAKADAVFLGAVGGPKWDTVAKEIRPEKGLFAIRQQMNVFANLRPAKIFPALAEASSLKSEIAKGLEFVIVRELISDIYFGSHNTEPHSSGERAVDEMVYTTEEIEQVARVAFEMAKSRKNTLTSVDKENVLDCSRLWRKVVKRIHEQEYPEVELKHLYVDNAAMQIASYPEQFDVMVTGNMFGDILSDLAGALTGSLGMLPSASLSDAGKAGLYEPIHGSAPDIAGKGIANPLASMLSIALMLQSQFNDAKTANMIEQAVSAVLDQGYRTADIARGATSISTAEMGSRVIEQLSAQLAKAA